LVGTNLKLQVHTYIDGYLIKKNRPTFIFCFVFLFVFSFFDTALQIGFSTKKNLLLPLKIQPNPSLSPSDSVVDVKISNRRSRPTHVHGLARYTAFILIYSLGKKKSLTHSLTHMIIISVCLFIFQQTNVHCFVCVFVCLNI
jgi:hypothetical protein